MVTSIAIALICVAIWRVSIIIQKLLDIKVLVDDAYLKVYQVYDLLANDKNEEEKKILWNVINDDLYKIQTLSNIK
jgi:hypothetical protein